MTTAKSLKPKTEYSWFCESLTKYADDITLSVKGRLCHLSYPIALALKWLTCFQILLIEGEWNVNSFSVAVHTMTLRVRLYNAVYVSIECAPNITVITYRSKAQCKTAACVCVYLD